MLLSLSKALSNKVKIRIDLSNFLQNENRYLAQTNLKYSSTVMPVYFINSL